MAGGIYAIFSCATFGVAVKRWLKVKDLDVPIGVVSLNYIKELSLPSGIYNRIYVLVI